jgi:sec-independent protein translocase protein TatA
MFAFLQGNEAIYLLIIAIVVFGGAKIPKLARSLGQAQNEFKQGLAEGAKDDDSTPTS